MTSCGGPCTLADIEPTISIPGEGTAGGQLDSSLQLVFQPIANRQYRVVAEMHAQSTPETTGVDGPEVDALSTGRVTRVLLAPGMTMTSSAQALGNYNVTTPESGTLVLFGSALAVLAWRRRRP